METNVLLPERGLRELHLFCGAGGGVLGGILLGHTCVCAVEIEPYCRKVLLQRQRDGILPKFPIWDDARTFDGKPWQGKVDVVCGGFPCQDISLAGKGEGIYGIRSGLWKQMARIVCEIRPKYIFVENSPALAIRGLGRVLSDMACMGYNASWGVLGADNAALDHRRKRIWILAHANRLRLKRKWAMPPQKKQSREQLERFLEFEAQMGIPAGSRGRIYDGLANRVDRLKAVGSGQVPAVVRLAWETLK